MTDLDEVVFPSSYSQRRLWFLEQFAPGSNAYNVPLVARVHGPLDVAAWTSCVAELAERHEVLRTRIEVDGEEVVQVIADRVDVPVAHRVFTGPGATGEARAFVAEAASRPFDLGTAPLFRAAIAEEGPERFVMAMVFHHAVCDGWSLALLSKELWSLYAEKTLDVDLGLTEPDLAFADWAEWQRGWMETPACAEELAHWTRALAGPLPVLEIPADHVRARASRPKGAVYTFFVSPDSSRRIDAASRALEATPFMTLLAAWNALLWRETGLTDIVVGTAVAGRTRQEAEGIVGFLANTLALRLALDPRQSFADLVGRAKRVTLDAYAHQTVPFDRVVEEIGAERSADHMPVFQTMLVLDNEGSVEAAPPGFVIEPLEVGDAQAPYDLMLSIERDGERYVGHLRYAAHLFAAGRMTRLAERFVRVLEHGLAAPTTTLAELPWVDAEDAAFVERAAHGAPLLPSRGDVVARLRGAALRHASRTALREGERTLGYRELDEASNALAVELRARGVTADVRVAIVARPCLETVVGIVAILKAGGAYVPLDPAAPAERLADAVADARALVVIGAPDALDGLSHHVYGAVPRVAVDLDARAVAGPDPRHREDSLAYVIYTSGSTGKPKGVGIEHRSLVAHLDAAGPQFGVSAEDVCQQLCSLSFDVSVEDLFLSLTSGATLSLRTPSLMENVRTFVERISAWDVSVLNLPTAFFGELLRGVEELGLRMPPRVRFVRIAGEAAPRDAVERWVARGEPRLVNGYGPTEATIVATSWDATAAGPGALEHHDVPIGAPMPGTDAWVLDADGRVVPPGVCGELALGGPRVARGYLDRPELTASRFVPDPFGGAPGGRLYLTGDLVRLRDDGQIEYLGRLDRQVKLRGYRIELGEIEATLRSLDGVKEASVIVARRPNGEQELRGWVTLDGSDDTAGLLEALGRRLPSYMVPARLHVVATMPLTPSGKIDRRALAALVTADARTEDAEPTPGVEARIAGLMAEILAVPRIGRHTSFFAAGGHSLLATRLVARLERTFEVQLPLRRLFESPTVAGLALAIEGSKASADAPLVGGEAGDGPAPLSFAQSRLYFLDRLEAGSAFYNVVFAAWLDGAVDGERLDAALVRLVTRHEPLRTRFEMEGTEPTQIVEPPPRRVLRRARIVGASADERRQRAEAAAHAEARRPFDLARGSVVRATLFEMDDDRSLFVIAMHHAVSDGWSMRLALREIGAAYLDPGRAPDPLPVRYRDFAAWQRATFSEARLAEQIAFWTETLRGIPDRLALPTDHPRRPVKRYVGGTRLRALPPSLARALDELARARSVTPFIVATTLVKAFLHRITGERDVVVGTPAARRVREELEPLIGCFVNTLVLRTRIPEASTLEHLLASVRDGAMQAYAHQDVPFEVLVEALDDARDESRTPLFQVMVVYENHDPVAMGDIPARPFDPETGTSTFDLTFTFDATSEGLFLAVEFDSDLFLETTIDRWTDAFRVFATEALASPGARLDALAMTEPSPARALPGPRVETLSYALHGEPSATAVSVGDEAMTYAELEQAADRVARSLRARGIRPGQRVAVCLSRDAWLLPVLLGVRRAGAAYVPLDPTFPPVRLEQMVEDARPALLLHSDRLGDVVRASEVRRLSLGSLLAEEGPRFPALDPHPELPAYVLFTSGSTGRPKGVEVPERGIRQILGGLDAHLALGPSDAWLATTTLSFDISAAELFLPLHVGARVILFPRDGVLDAEALHETVVTRQATVLQLTPSAWRLLLASGFRGSPALRTALTGGEALPLDLAERLASIAPRVFNVYGPTETTVWSSIERVTAKPLPITVGLPLAGNRLNVVDGCMRELPVGVPGELAIGGLQVAHGYVGRPALTAERFLPDPFSDLPGARTYLTGDVARRRSDERVQWVGRSDAQIKHRGHRIELGDIEAALRSEPLVRDAACVLRRESEGTRLIAYVVGAVDASALRARAEEALPSYMVPEALVVLPSMPLTPNGKTDRQRLPWPAPREAGWSDVQGGSPESPVVGADASPRVAVVASAFAEVLPKGTRIGEQTSFFRAGGDSLAALRLVARLRDRGFDLRVAELARADSPARVAPLLRQRDEGASASAAVPELRGARGIPLSGLQRGFLFFSMEGDEHAYLEQSVHHAEERLDEARFTRAWREVLRALPVLRSVVGDDPDGTPVLVATDVVVDPGWVDGDDEGCVARVLAEHRREDWNPRRGPLLRATVVRGARGSDLVLSFHHVLLDGWSAERVVDALGDAYRGRPVRATDQTAAFAAHLASTSIDARQRAVRDAVPRPELGAARLFGDPRPLTPPRGRVTYERIEHRVTGAESEALQRAARGFGVSPATVFFAAHAIAVASLSGESPITSVRFGTLMSGRSAPIAGIDEAVGMFVNTLPVVVDVARTSLASEIVARVHAAMIRLLEIEHVPLQEVLAPLGTTPGELPYESIVVYAPRPPERERSSLFTPTVEPVPRTGYPLHLGIQPDGTSFVLTWTRNADVLTGAALARVAHAFQVALHALCHAASAPVEALDVLRDEDRAFLRRVNATATELAPLTIDAWLARQVATTPQASALSFRGRSLDYAELGQHVDALAASLVGRGVERGSVVGLVFHRSLEMVIAIHAVMRAGAAFLPLDPEAPVSRLRELLDDAQPTVVLHDGRNAERVREVTGGARTLVEVSADRAPELRSSVARRHGPTDLAYVLFTSGSTGRPKAAMLEHAGLYNRIRWMQRTFTLGSADVVLQKTPYTFDVSMWEFFWPLVVGATLAIAEPGAHYEPLQIARTIVDEKVTVLHFVPSMLQTFVEAVPAEAMRSVRLLVTSGEALPSALVARVRARYPWIQLHNLYGPTEASIDVTWWPCQEVVDRVPIGRPIDNVVVHVVDERLRPVPPGVPGELLLGGVQLARGYMNRPGLTAERFVPDGLTVEAPPGARLYRTGDRVRLMDDGAIDFIGRIDFQVKLRGLRIELGEIEERLRKVADVRDAVVGVQGVGEDARLVAWLLVAAGGEPVGPRARDALRRELPEYMVPTNVLELSAWPLTKSGKVDRKALPEVPYGVVDVGDSSATRSTTERLVADVFAGLVGATDLSGDTSFFDVGGHSMLALQLVARLQKATGARLSVQDIFRAPTIAGIAAQLEAASEERRDPSLVVLNEGEGRPVVWIHPVGGGVLGYRAIAMRVAEARPHFALTSRTDEARRAHSVLDLVEHYGSELLKLPFPSFDLVGWSMGGVIGWELAEWLDARGRRVESLTMLDSFPVLPEAEPTAELIEVVAAELGVEAPRVAQAVLTGEWGDVAAALGGHAAESLASIAQDIADNLRRAREHVVTRASRPFVLLEAEMRDEGLEAPHRSWGASAGAMPETVRVACDHYGFFDGAAAEETVAVIRRNVDG